jgi:hypothetical protein
MKIKVFIIIPALMLAIASFSGCENKGLICGECENNTDTVYVQVADRQQDSIMDLLCHKWKLEAFVDDTNGTHREPEDEHYENVSYIYTLEFDNTDGKYTYSGFSCPSSFGGIFMIDANTSSIHFRRQTNLYEDVGDPYLYVMSIDDAKFFEVTSNSLKVFTSTDYQCYLIFKKFQEL